MTRSLLLLSLAACTSGAAPSDEEAIRQVMARQEEAWDQGDILGFMEGYADTICFIGSSGRRCGKEAVTAHYLRSYPDRAAMGDLAFTDLEVVPAGTHHAWVTGRWSLYRTTDTLGGGFSLLWVNDTKDWRIVRDHTY